MLAQVGANYPSSAPTFLQCVESKRIRRKSQAFFQGPNRKYFVVTIPEGYPLAESTHSSGLQNLIESVLQEASKRDTTQKVLHEVSDVQFLVSETAWLRHTGWDRIFVGKDMAKLVELTSKATKCGASYSNCVNGVQDCVDRNWSLVPF